MEALHASSQSLITTNLILNVFLSRYSEFVAITPERQPAREAH